MRRLTTRATHGLWLAAVLTLAGCPLFAPFLTASPQLRLIPAAFEFTDLLTVDSFTITNGGGGVLLWEVESTPPWLQVTSASSGSLTATQSARVVLETATTGLPDGILNGFVVVTSNGGRAEIPVVVGIGAITLQPSIRVAPAMLDFGRTATERTLAVSNGGIQGDFTFAATANQPWITDITPAAGTVSTNTVNVTVAVSRAGLSDGVYEGIIRFTAPDLDDFVVSVRMEVVSDLPVLSVSPGALDFGVQTNTLTTTIRNTGRGTLAWEVIEDLPWLEVSPQFGTTTTESDVLTVSVSRLAQPPGLLEGSFLVRTSDGQEVEVEVSAEVRDATLVVLPTTLDFGTNQTTKIVTITNGGVGTVNWSINTAGLPSWLTLVNTAGSVTTGSDAVLVTVDRTGLPPQVFSASFEVTSNAGSATVTVTASVLLPALEVTSGLTNSQGQPATTQSGVPLVDLGTQLNTATFVVRNSGTGVLNWDINSAQFQSWFTLSPVQGSLTEGQAQTVTVTVSREGGFGGNTATLAITSNAGNGAVVVARTIPKVARLGVDPAEISLGSTESTGTFLAANFGDEGTAVEYEIISDRDWLFVSPDRGASQGTATPPPFKDFRPHNVFIDRSRLGGNGGVATLTLRATSVNTSQSPADVPGATVRVVVEAAPLTFEQALLRGRVPSMIRFTFTMRDLFFNTITTPVELITAGAFNVLEDGVPLELNETNIFLTDQYDANIVLLLDYSGSMQLAAGRILGGSNPLQDIYEATIPAFLNQLPPRFKVSLMAFFDRDQSTRLQSGFTRDRAETIAALQALRTDISLFGATELIPALRDGALLFVTTAGFNVPFDDPDVRAVVSISDGRGTTPPGDVSELADGIEFTRARFFNIAWGVSQDFAVPGTVATRTGGHFYYTQNATGPGGIEVPSVDALAERLAEIAFDLQQQYLLTYITLNHASTATIRATAAFDPPEDDGTPQNQGVIQGSFEQDASPAVLVGDTRLGQLSMRSQGIQPGGSAEVIIRSDYAPREISAFEFTITATEPFFVERVAQAEGGITADWALAQVGNTFSLVSPDGPLPYGIFGPMLRLVFTGPVAPALEVDLTVNNALYAAPPASARYFTYPSSIRVLPGEDALAQAFPTPQIDIDPSTPDVIEEPFLIVIPSTDDSVQVLLRNTGGVHVPTGVVLNWAIGAAPSFVASATGPDGQPFGTLTATGETNLITLQMNRDGLPGEISEVLAINYDTGTLGYSGVILITLETTIETPILAVDTPGPANSIDFGDSFNTATIIVRNDGQGTLAWSIDTTVLPPWLVVEPVAGFTGAGAASVVTVTVERTGLASGIFNAAFTVSGFGQAEVVTVIMEVP